MEEQAPFTLDCFWSPDDYYSKLDSVIGTKVSYAGNAENDRSLDNFHRTKKHHPKYLQKTGEATC